MIRIIGEAIDRKDSDKEVALECLQGVEDADFVAAFVAVAGVDAGADEAVADEVGGTCFYAALSTSSVASGDSFPS